MGLLFPDKTTIGEVYNYSPAFNNLYTLELFPFGVNTSTGIDIDISNMFEYHATKISFGGESLKLKRNEVTKKFEVEDSPFQRTDTVSITIRENEKWDVKRYHDEWLSKFYNKEGDYYISYSVNSSSTSNSSDTLYRILRIYLPGDTPGVDTACVIMKILPQNTGGFDLQWGSGDIVSHNLIYYVEKWKWGDNL